MNSLGGIVKVFLVLLLMVYFISDRTSTVDGIFSSPKIVKVCSDFDIKKQLCKKWE